VIKFWITTRPKPGMEREQFDYEWGVIHTSMMVTTPSVLNGSFKRYTQHRSVIDGVDDADLMYARSAEGWYSCADHLCASYEDVVQAVVADDYRRRMFPHRFSDRAMVVELTDTEVLLDATPTRLDAGGVKVINHVRSRAGVGQDEFTEWWRAEYAPVLIDVAGGGPVHRYVQNPSVPGDPAFFKGSLFELGNTGTYAGVEELSFDDLEGVRQLRRVPAVHDTLRAKAAELIDLDRSFGLVVVERVVFDFTGDRASQAPAVRDPDSIEQAMLRSERAWDTWNAIRPVGSPKIAGE
jgi:EthD domain